MIHWLYMTSGPIWIGLVPVTAALGWLAAIGVARTKAWIAAARRGRALRDGAGGVDRGTGAPRVVEGVLTLLEKPASLPPSAIVFRTIAPARALGPERHERVAAEVGVVTEDGAEVALEGVVSVAVGSTQAIRLASWRAEQLFPLRGAPLARTASSLAVRALRFGDRVTARGTLSTHAVADVPVGYRAPPVRFVLTEATLAARGAPRIRAFGFDTHARGLVVGSAIGFIALAVAGPLLLALGGGGPRLSGSELSTTAIAASMPNTREAALRQLYDRLEVDEGDDGTRIDRATIVLDLLGDCDASVSLLRRHARWRTAATQAARCRLPFDATPVFQQGEFALASDLYAMTGHPPSFDAAEAHIAAHRWADAAREVKRLADVLYGARDGDFGRDRTEAIRCIADALAARTGDDAARMRLQGAARDRAMCRVLLADRAPAPVRRTLLGPISFSWAWRDNQGMDFAKGRVVWTAARLLEEIDGPQHVELYDWTIFPDAALHGDGWEATHRDDIPVGLCHQLLVDEDDVANQRSPESPGKRADAENFRVSTAGNVALFLATLDDIDEARATLERMRDVPTDPREGGGYGWHRPRVSEILQAIDTIDAAPDRASRWRASVQGGSCIGCGFFSAMDAAARRSLNARARGSAADRERAGAEVRRFRDAVFDREIAVPLHMLEAFAPERSP